MHQQLNLSYDEINKKCYQDIIDKLEMLKETSNTKIESYLMNDTADEINEAYRKHYIERSMSKEITGARFNELHKGKRFYKFLNNNLLHYDHTYKLGLNEDILQFDTTFECSAGGLYFCEEDECHLYWDCYGSKLAVIEIPNDARVYIELHKFKADKIVLTSITDFDDVSDEFWIKLVPKDGMALQYVDVQTEDLCVTAFKLNNLAYTYVKDKTPLIQELFTDSIKSKPQLTTSQLGDWFFKPFWNQTHITQVVGRVSRLNHDHMLYISN